jgi:protein NrfD
VAKMTIPIGVILGVYTGILLNSLVARPFWNSAIMGPLFLVSGASTGAAIIILFSKNHKERNFFSKIDLGLIGLELALIVLFVIGMLTSTAVSHNAIKLILGGPLTAAFWSIVVVMGLSVPAFLEILELKGKEIPVFISAGLVLVGGLALRFIITEAGQISSWLPY